MVTRKTKTRGVDDGTHGMCDKSAYRLAVCI